MAKLILVHEPKGDGTRDRGEEQYYLACDNAGIRKVRGFGGRITVEKFPISDIVRVDCFRGDELANNMLMSDYEMLMIIIAIAGLIVSILTYTRKK